MTPADGQFVPRPVSSVATSAIVELWDDERAPDYAYFAAAESDDWLSAFWDRTTGATAVVFQDLFAELDLEATLELASGQGRHSAQIADRCGRLVLTDTSAPALAAADVRFAALPHVSTVRSLDGMTVPIADDDGGFSAVFSFDALVHFELECVASYLGETARLLRPGGRALIHHSNYQANPGGQIQENPSWRNFMSVELFAHFARRQGLEVLEQRVLSWNGVTDSDGLSLLQRP